MFRRKRKQPWWTYPVAFIAAIAAIVQAERTTKLIWRGMVKRTAMRKLLEFLDDRFPSPTSRDKVRTPKYRSTL